ncbi:macrophage mannose receptor 1-like [Siphateles boraxobius]|uniref:macrophage mannose receptor 1-like n=1 Tax=Siphateles boraxobius TaxID=180520 RepID=UPI004064A8E5
MLLLSVLLLLWAFPPSTAEGRLRKFYIVKKKNISRTTAEEECKTNNYTGLVTVYDQQDNIKLSNLIKSKNASSGWIGTRRGNRSKKWSNGDDVTFNRSTAYSGKIRCAAMKADGDWESILCSIPKHFMCYEQAIGVGRKSYDFRLIREDRSWFEAQMYCREHHTDLVSIRDQTENERVKEKGKESNTPFWIGLLEDSVEWADEGRSAYRNWDFNWNPDSKSHYPEAYMDLNGNWHGSTGSTFYPLCYKSFIHVSKENMSWEEALDYCDRDFSGLLIIRSENDQIETERELERRKISGPVWVGLRQSRLFGFWIWINGLNARNWSNWKGGSPPEHQISEHCGAIEKVDGQYKWSDKDCRCNFTVLCE